jgi:iodotyrosine deiodinase
MSEGRDEGRGAVYRRLFPGLPEPVYEELAFRRYPDQEMLARARRWYEELGRRRSVREFSPEPVSRELIELAIATAGTAPSGAHRQPWTFVAVDDPVLKREIRHAAEDEEWRTYTGRMSEEWRLALAPLGTDWVKTHITDAPWLVVLFKRSYELLPDGRKAKNYYVSESVGICAGLFIASVHHMGLATLPHTPNPTRFLSRLLRRPANESAVMLFPVGYPKQGARVPRLQRKRLAEYVQWNRSPAEHGQPPAAGGSRT